MIQESADIHSKNHTHITPLSTTLTNSNSINHYKLRQATK